MDEILKKPFLTKSPFRYDTKVGFITSLIMFIILNTTSVLIIMNLTALSTLGGGNLVEDLSWFLGDGLVLFVIVFFPVLILYIPIIVYKNMIKNYNIFAVIKFVFFINFGSLIFFMWFFSL